MVGRGAPFDIQTFGGRCISTDSASGFPQFTGETRAPIG